MRQRSATNESPGEETRKNSARALNRFHAALTVLLGRALVPGEMVQNSEQPGRHNPCCRIIACVGYSGGALSELKRAAKVADPDQEDVEACALAREWPCTP